MSFKLPPKSSTPAPSERTPLDCALLAVERTSGGAMALAVLCKLTRNVQGAPREEKYRKLNPANEKIAAMLAAGGAGVLAQIGWVEETRDGETALVLPLKVQCTMQQVRAIDDAMAALVKRMEEDRRAASRKRAADPEKARLHAQLEADRRERAARGPVTQGSKANKLDFGANVTTAKEAGCCSSGA